MSSQPSGASRKPHHRDPAASEETAVDQDRRHAERVDRLVDDLRQFARSAERIVARGREAYLDPDDDLLRRAGRSVIVDVSAAVDRLPAEFQDRYPDIPWRNIRDTRNYIAHRCESVLDDLVWEALRTHVPELVRRITDTGDR